jgi:hypothetical protein
VLVGQMVAGMGLVLYGRGIEPVAAHDVLGAGLAGLLARGDDRVLPARPGMLNPRHV